MKIGDFLKTLNVKLDKHIEDIHVKGVTDNSKEVEDGYIFIAINGYQVDGHDYISDAIQNGAVLIIGEQELNISDVPYIRVENSRKALGIISKHYYHDPSKGKIMIGITGTNGKTTTSYLIQHIVEKCGKTCSMIGTIQNSINGRTLPSFNTTPNALMINRLLAESTDDVVVMEVSSHGLDQCRVEGIEFDIGIFTNLYHEHLDYHQTMEEYFQAKLLLFDHLKENGIAITNTDNSWGEKLKDILTHHGISTFSIGESAENDVQLIDYSVKNAIVTVQEKETTFEVICPIPGIHNMYNTMMAYLTTRHINLSRESIQQALTSFTGVNGRFETYKHDNLPTVVVDYAHTPDAIFHCIASAKTYGAKRIFHVFGFRGGRDKSKRPEMLSITSKYSDAYYLTFDDLNSVSETEMIETMEEVNRKFGNQKGSVIPDRTMAIQKAIKMASDEDWVIITGKGHESYKHDLELATNSDKETVQYILNQLKEQTIVN